MSLREGLPGLPRHLQRMGPEMRSESLLPLVFWDLEACTALENRLFRLS